MLDLTRFIPRAEALHVLGVKVSQHGELVGEYLFEADCRRNVYSASKSFTAVAVGIAQAEGLLSVDEKLADAFAGDLPQTVCNALAAATVRDLLTMRLGQERPFLMGEERISRSENDWVKLTLAQPFVHMPGEVFMYSNAGPYLAGVLVQRRAGCNLVDYLMPRLFAPLGMVRPSWEEDPQKYTFGAGGLMLPLKDLHKFGLLMLQKGVWEGRQLVPADWVQACMTAHGENPRYGYLFWGGPEDSFRADGKYGQLSMILPHQDAVISLLSECRAPGLLDAVFDEILPLLRE